MSVLLSTMLVASCAATSAPDPVPSETRPPLGWRELLKRPRQPADARIAYGTDPSQFAELWLPKAAAPGRKAPVVVLVHGGCWQAPFGLDLMDWMAADLRDRGFAVWNVEYRRLGNGGGYPATFQDVGAAFDALRGAAKARSLDLERVVAVGHSAGGHLAVWAAHRDGLPTDSPLRTADPLKVRGVVSLAGILDLADYRANGGDRCGGPEIVDRLVGADVRPEAVRYRDTSPAALQGGRVREVVLSAEKDDVVPPPFGRRYAEARPGVQAVTYPGAGHFELIDPTSAIWPDVVARIERAFR